jgi:hypothetical protein
MQAVLGIYQMGEAAVTAGSPKPNRPSLVSGLYIRRNPGGRLAKLQVYTQQGDVATPPSAPSLAQGVFRESFL